VALQRLIELLCSKIVCNEIAKSCPGVFINTNTFVLEIEMIVVFFMQYNLAGKQI